MTSSGHGNSQSDLGVILGQERLEVFVEGHVTARPAARHHGEPKWCPPGEAHVDDRVTAFVHLDRVDFTRRQNLPLSVTTGSECHFQNRLVEDVLRDQVQSGTNSENFRFVRDQQCRT